MLVLVSLQFVSSQHNMHSVQAQSPKASVIVLRDGLYECDRRRPGQQAQHVSLSGTHSAKETYLLGVAAGLTLDLLAVHKVEACCRLKISTVLSPSPAGLVERKRTDAPFVSMSLSASAAAKAAKSSRACKGAISTISGRTGRKTPPNPVRTPRSQNVSSPSDATRVCHSARSDARRPSAPLMSSNERETDRKRAMEERIIDTHRSEEGVVSSLPMSKADTPERNNRLTPGGSTGDQLVAQLREVQVLAEAPDSDAAKNKGEAILLCPRLPAQKQGTHAGLVLGLDLLSSLSLVRVLIEKVDYRRGGGGGKASSQCFSDKAYCSA